MRHDQSGRGSFPGDDVSATHRDEQSNRVRRELENLLPRKSSPRRRDLRWAVILFAVFAAIQIQRVAWVDHLTAEEMFWLQASAVFPGVVGLGFLAAFLFVRNGNGSE